jgi:branched-subunit amino acid transport protein
MSKVLIGLILGAVLGAIDGASAGFYDAITKDQVLGIVAGSTFKGLATGVVAGLYARRTRSLGKGILLGLAVGFLLSLAVAALPSPDGVHYYVEIILPGMALGAIVGFATQRYGLAKAPA